VSITQREVDAGTTLRIEMATGGRQAVRIRPAR
jgi:hypothetical protein